MPVSFSNLPTTPALSRALFLRMKDAVLGKPYRLSVAFVGKAEMRHLNRTYRGKNSSTDILSFPLGKGEGEIVFCMEDVRKMAPDFDRTPQNFLPFLFIHGLCHLKGMAHGSRMEGQEKKYRKKFNI